MIVCLYNIHVHTIVIVRIMLAGPDHVGVSSDSSIFGRTVTEQVGVSSDSSIFGRAVTGVLVTSRPAHVLRLVLIYCDLYTFTT